MVKGDIVLIRFPFTDLTNTKVRPALVLSTYDDDITVSFITSRLYYQDMYDIVINPTKRNGLKKNSVIRVNKIVTLDNSLALGLLGKISAAELNMVNEALEDFLELHR
jgi:mRNA interferase MazF